MKAIYFQKCSYFAAAEGGDRLWHMPSLPDPPSYAVLAACVTLPLCLVSLPPCLCSTLPTPPSFLLAYLLWQVATYPPVCVGSLWPSCLGSAPTRDTAKASFMGMLLLSLPEELALRPYRIGPL